MAMAVRHPFFARQVHLCGRRQAAQRGLRACRLEPRQSVLAGSDSGRDRGLMSRQRHSSAEREDESPTQIGSPSRRHG
jgi:hypothetical protein